MNKKIRIGVFASLAVVLLLGISVPALAGHEYVTCSVNWWVHVENSLDDVQVVIPGDAELILDGDTLTRSCVGNIPLGEPSVDPNGIYFDLDEMREYAFDTWGIEIRGLFSIGSDDIGGQTGGVFYKGEWLFPEGWLLRVRENGNFILESYFDVSE